MPNWVRTKLNFSGDAEKIKELRNFVTSTSTDENGKTRVDEFDFNNIIPMPEDLNIEAGSTGEWGMEYILAKKKDESELTEKEKELIHRIENEESEERREKFLETGQKYIDNKLKYGFESWYGWCCHNWGTKWGSTEVNWYSDDYVVFETAWTFPYKVIQKLSELFPDVEIHFIYADEDTSSNTGSGSFYEGEDYNTEYPDTGSDEGYENYMEAWDAQDELYKGDDGRWHWVDEEDEFEFEIEDEDDESSLISMDDVANATIKVSNEPRD